MKQISIIGCGWLGLPLAKLLLTEGYTVLGTTTTPYKEMQLKAAGIQPFFLELNGEQPAAEAFKALWASPLHIITLPPGRQDPNVGQAYPQRLQWLLEGIIEHGPSKPWVIYTSSTGVYGNSAEYLREETPLQPSRESAKAILAAEELLLRYSGQLDSTILRLAGLVGPQRPAGRFLAGKENLQSGNKPVNLIHQADVLEIIRQLIAKELKNEVYNLCSEKHPFQKNFYPAQTKKLGLTPPTFAAESDSPKRIVVNDKIKAALDYKFKYPDPQHFPLED